MQALFTGLGVVAARLGTFLLQFLGFLVVLGIGWLVARGVEAAIAGILRRVRFDELVERGGVKRALDRIGYDAAGILGRLVFYTILLFALQFAFGVFGPNPVSAVLNQVIAYLPRVFAAGLIVIIGAAVAAFVREALDAAIGGVTYGKTIAAFAGGAVLYIAAFMALDELAIATSIVNGLFFASLAAIAGTIIVAAGGGGIPTMQRWWERASMRVETAAPAVRAEAQGAQERIKERTEERTEQAKQMTQQPEREKEPAGAPAGGAGQAPQPSREREHRERKK